MARKNSNSSRFITEQQFFQDCKRVDLRDLPVEPSYPEFLKFFKKLPKITKHDMIIGINFTYGWMPTIFDFQSNEFADAVKILNLAKEGADLTVEQLTKLRDLFNNSLVGTTKLLHFISPTRFAIWDSRVYRYFYGEEPHQYRIGDGKRYLVYLEFCNRVASNKDFDKIHESICDKLGYRVTKLRSIDLLMYYMGEKK